MHGIDGSPTSVQHLTRDQWDKVASGRGEVRLARDGAGAPTLYNSTRTLGGRFLGTVRDLVSSDAAVAGRQLEKAVAADRAIKELRWYLGPQADKLFASAGVAGSRLTAAQVRSVLAAYDPKKDHTGATFKERLADPDALIFSRKVRSLEAEAEKITGTDAPSTRKREALLDQRKALAAHTAATQAAKATERWDAVIGHGTDPETVGRPMKLAIEMRTLAGSLAVSALNNGRVQSRVAQELFRAHEAELRSEHGDAAFNLARELASNTVLMDLAVGRLNLPNAVLAVRTAAHRAGCAPTTMLELMGNQFDCEVGAFDRATVVAGEHKKDEGADGNFSFDEIPLAGDMVASLHARIVDIDHDHAAAPLQYAPGTLERFVELGQAVEAWGNDTGLESVEAVAKSLAGGPAKAPSDAGSGKATGKDLGKDLGTPPLPWVQAKHTALFADIRKIGGADAPVTLKRATDAVPLPGTRGLTERQYALLRAVRADAVEGKAPDGTTRLALCDRPLPSGSTPKQEVLAHLKQRFGLASDAEAAAVLRRAEDWFKTAPLTLTIPADKVFAKGPHLASTAYTASQERGTSQLSADAMRALVGGEGRTAGLAAPMSSELNRGDNYLPWRVEKDDIELGHRGLSRTEQAKFAGININLDESGGFEGNSTAYGHTHIVLKPEVRERALYNFNKTRELRADLTMIFYDALQDRNDSGAAISKTTGKPVGKPDYIDAVVHKALGLPGMVKTDRLLMEVEVFGDLDLVDDVLEVRVPTPESYYSDRAPNLYQSEEISNNVAEFYGSRNIPVSSYDMAAVRSIDLAKHNLGAHDTPGTHDLDALVRIQASIMTAKDAAAG